VSGDRSLQHLGKLADLSRRVVRTCTDENHRMASVGDRLRRPFQGTRIGRRSRLGAAIDVDIDHRALSEDIPRSLDRNGAHSLVRHLTEALSNYLRRFGRMIDPLSPTQNDRIVASWSGSSCSCPRP